jgi:hypothetical protein
MGLQVFIDGTDVSSFALEGSSTRRLNRLSQATVKFPMDAVVGSVGSRMKVVFDGELHHHGRVMTRELDGGEDFGYVVYNSEDPLELWKWRPVRDPVTSLTPGNMINPTILEDEKSGPQIVRAMMEASENSALIPDAAEGSLFLEYGNFQTGGADLSGAPTNFPMTMMDMASLLTSTGRLDIVLEPIDSGGNMARLSAHNGRYGADRRGSVIFEYGMGDHTIRGMQWNQDLSNTVNKLQYFFTPRPTDTRYKGNITGDDPCLNYGGGYDGPGGSIRGCKAGGGNPLGALRNASQADYGVRFEAQEFDIGELAKEDHGQPPGGNPCSATCDTRDPRRDLWRWLWQVESTIRARPRDLYHISPIRGFGINSFDIGDLITVRAGPQVLGGFSLVGRVYEYTVSWTADGPFELSEIVTSPSQEGY